MRRIKFSTETYDYVNGNRVPLGLISVRDFRLMRAAIKSLESIAQTPSPHCARDPFLCKALARNAIDAFNAPRKTK